MALLKYTICIECLLSKSNHCICSENPKSYSGIAYCFIHEDENHENNFKPHACQTPKRVNNAKHLLGKCALFGLSFFKDAEKAKTLHRDMNGRGNANSFSETNGTLLASVNLSPQIGVYDEIDAKSHFNFFEYVGVNLFDNIKNKEII
jgi:hypothetical protein